MQFDRTISPVRLSTTAFFYTPDFTATEPGKPHKIWLGELSDSFKDPVDNYLRTRRFLRQYFPSIPIENSSRIIQQGVDSSRVEVHDGCRYEGNPDTLRLMYILKGR